jgi:hypothetical protein
MKRGAPLRRRARLRAKASLRRSSRLSPVNRERAAARKLEAFGTDARAVWWREQACACQGRHPACTGGWSERAHVTSRGAGGGAADIIPLSSGCHHEQHQHGWGRWLELAGLERGAARELADRLARRGPDAPGCRVGG